MAYNTPAPVIELKNPYEWANQPAISLKPAPISNVSYDYGSTDEYSNYNDTKVVFDEAKWLDDHDVGVVDTTAQAYRKLFPDKFPDHVTDCFGRIRTQEEISKRDKFRKHLFWIAVFTIYLLGVLASVIYSIEAGLVYGMIPSVITSIVFAVLLCAPPILCACWIVIAQTILCISDLI